MGARGINVEADAEILKFSGVTNEADLSKVKWWVEKVGRPSLQIIGVK